MECDIERPWRLTHPSLRAHPQSSSRGHSLDRAQIGRHSPVRHLAQIHRQPGTNGLPGNPEKGQARHQNPNAEPALIGPANYIDVHLSLDFALKSKSNSKFELGSLLA